MTHPRFGFALGCAPAYPPQQPSAVDVERRPCECGATQVRISRVVRPERSVHARFHCAACSAFIDVIQAWDTAGAAR